MYSLLQNGTFKAKGSYKDAIPNKTSTLKMIQTDNKNTLKIGQTKDY